MTIKPKNIDHICLWVRSLTQAKAYYEKVFGFICTPRQGSTDTLIVESDHIHFFIQETGDDARFIDKQHLSFEVDSLHDVITSLNKMGISDYETGQVDFFSRRNYKWCEWRDPDGIRLECIESID